MYWRVFKKQCILCWLLIHSIKTIFLIFYYSSKPNDKSVCLLTAKVLVSRIVFASFNLVLSLYSGIYATSSKLEKSVRNSIMVPCVNVPLWLTSVMRVFTCDVKFCGLGRWFEINTSVSTELVMGVQLTLRCAV